MQEITNHDKFDAPCICFDDLPSGVAEKVEVGDTVVSKCGPDEVTAEVIEIDKEAGCIYLTKELPVDGCELSVQETATGTAAPYDAMKKEAGSAKENVLTGPLPALKKLLIQISIEEGK